MTVEVLLARIEPNGRNLPAHAWLCLTDEDRAMIEHGADLYVRNAQRYRRDLLKM